MTVPTKSRLGSISRCSSKPGAVAGVRHAFESVGQRRRVTRIVQQPLAVVLDQSAQPFNARRNHGQPRRHVLEQLKR